MVIDWGKVGDDAKDAIAQVLGANWQSVSSSASGQLTELMRIGQSIEQAVQATPPQITQTEYESLKVTQQRAISGVLQTYAATGIAVAEEAAAAAWNVVAQALKTAYGLPFIP